MDDKRGKNLTFPGCHYIMKSNQKSNLYSFFRELMVAENKQRNRMKWTDVQIES